MQLNITEMIESIGKSVSAAQQSLEQHNINCFMGYFVEIASDGETPYLRPKTARISVPSAGDVNQSAVIGVPLAALSSHRSVSLEQGRDGDNFSGHSMELVFNVSEPSEGIARIAQDITKIL